MIHLDKISLAYGDQQLFDQISYTVKPPSKIGLVGRNGSGKTTLLKAITGMIPLDSGSISMPRDFNCAFLPQEIVLTSEKTVFDEALSAFPLVGKAYETVQRIEPMLTHTPDQIDATTMEEYADAQHILMENSIEHAQQYTNKILDGLGFSDEQCKKQVNALSVGWKMRLLLATLLLQQADFYLFDEPTNHLDLPTKDWFLSFLRNAPFGCILVSHDKYFLDSVCDTIIELDNGKLHTYNGGYSAYEQQKDERLALVKKQYEEQQKYIKQQTKTIERFRAKANKAAMAQSMIKALAKIDLIELPNEQKNTRFKLPTTPHAGKTILDAHNLSFAFGDTPVFNNVSFQILRGQRVAIVAPNGTGKTTLLNIIMQNYKPKAGSFSLGYQVQPAYFEQDQYQSLNTRNTIIDEVESACTTSEQRKSVRSMLGAFLFSGDDVFKPISVLSGGEKNRVAMAKILLQSVNFLVLDEPTNHLDIPSKDRLCELMLQFQGTILFVSHDHHFLNTVATHVLELTPNGAHLYHGNYDSYVHQQHEHLARNTSKQPTAKKAELNSSNEKSKKTSANNSYEERKLIRQIESKIARRESEQLAFAERLSTLTFGTTAYTDASKKLQTIEKELSDLMKQWENLMG